MMKSSVVSKTSTVSGSTIVSTSVTGSPVEIPNGTTSRPNVPNNGYRRRVAHGDPRLSHCQPVNADFVIFGGRKEEVLAVEVFNDQAAQRPAIDRDFKIELGRVEHDVAFRDAVEVLLPEGEHFERAAEHDGVRDVRTPVGEALIDDGADRVLVGTSGGLQFGHPLLESAKLLGDGPFRGVRIEKRWLLSLPRAFRQLLLGYCGGVGVGTPSTWRGRIGQNGCSERRVLKRYSPIGKPRSCDGKARNSAFDGCPVGMSFADLR